MITIRIHVQHIQQPTLKYNTVPMITIQLLAVRSGYKINVNVLAVVDKINFLCTNNYN